MHFIISTAGPLHFFPPQDGAGLLQNLVFSFTQEAVQFPTNQSDHPPSTTLYMMKNCQLFSHFYMYVFLKAVYLILYTYVHMIRAQNNGLSQVIFWPTSVYDRQSSIW